MHRLLLALALGAAVSGCTKQQFAMPSNAPLQVPQGDPEPEVTEPVVAEVVPEAPQAAPDLVALDAAATHRYIKAGKAGEVVTRLRITTDAQTDKPRPPANIGLIVDTSASMKGEAIEQARQAALTMLDGLEEGDRFSVVSFGSTATVLVPSVEVSDETTAEIRAAIEGMEAVGTTALARGLAASFEQVRPHVRQDTVSRMVLLSDGVPNDPAPIRGLAQQAASQSISIAALGLGVDFDETLLADIASSSGGRFHFIEDTDQVAAMFRDEVLHIDRLVAVGSMMTLTGGPGVTITEVLGHPQFAAGSRSVSVRTGDLAEGETKDIVVRLAVGEHRDGATVELLDATLQYTDATVGAGLLDRSAFLAVEATNDDAQRISGLDIETELVAAKAITAAETLRIVQRARSGDVKGALAQLTVAEKKARRLAKKNEDEELTALANELSTLRKTIPSLAPPKRRGRRPGRKLPASMDIGGSVMPVPYDAGGGSGTRGSSGTGSLQQAQSLKRSHSRAFNALH